MMEATTIAPPPGAVYYYRVKLLINGVEQWVEAQSPIRPPDMRHEDVHVTVAQVEFDRLEARG